MKQLFTKPLQQPMNSVSVMKDVMPDAKKESGIDKLDLTKDLTASGNKNLWMGTKSSMTYAKRAPQHTVPNFQREFNPDQRKRLKSFIESVDYVLTEAMDGTVSYARNRITTTGTNSSAVPHGIMHDRVQANKPYKPKDGTVETWLDTMPQRKKNAGLTHLQKKDTLERKLALENN